MRAVVALFRAGHVPIIGVNLALPLIEVAGEAAFDEIMMPLSLSLVDRCERFRASGRPVYSRLAEVPGAR